MQDVCQISDLFLDIMKSVAKKTCQSLNCGLFIKIVILSHSQISLLRGEAHFDNFVEPERGLSNHPHGSDPSRTFLSGNIYNMSFGHTHNKQHFKSDKCKMIPVSMYVRYPHIPFCQTRMVGCGSLVWHNPSYCL